MHSPSPLPDPRQRPSAADARAAPCQSPAASSPAERRGTAPSGHHSSPPHRAADPVTGTVAGATCLADRQWGASRHAPACNGPSATCASCASWASCASCASSAEHSSSGPSSKRTRPPGAQAPDSKLCPQLSTRSSPPLATAYLFVHFCSRPEVALLYVFLSSALSSGCFSRSV